MAGFTSNGYFDLNQDADKYDILDGIVTLADKGLRGLEGNDTLNGSFTTDIIFGNTGNDVITGGGSNDTIYGGQGNDILSGDDGDDLIFGNRGSDWLKASGGNDRLYGGQGNDVIVGGVGDETLAGELGYDILTGNTGVNTFAINPAAFGAANLDVILDFQRTTDRIALTRGLKANTLTLESTAISTQDLANGIAPFIGGAITAPGGFSTGSNTPASIAAVRNAVVNLTGVDPNPSGSGIIPGVLIRNNAGQPLAFIAGESPATIGGRFAEFA